MRTPVLVGAGIGVAALVVAALANREKTASLWNDVIANIPTVRR